MVVFHGHHWRVVFEMSAPGEAHVHIFGVAISVQLPHSRHLHRAPCLVVERGVKEVGGSLVGVLHPFEFPHAVERQIVAAAFHVAL